MTVKLRYHFPMKRLKAAAVVGLGALGLVLVPVGAGQINGVPASVTSIGFGGHPGPHGVPPSVTSIGPQGLVPNNQIPLPGVCCINPLFPSNPNPATDHHHHHRPANGGFVYAIPYAVPYYADDQGAESSADDQYNGGPTIFDRRGSGQPAPYTEPQQVSQNVVSAAPAAPSASGSEPAGDQPQTLLVFKDGHQMEVSNYAIVGSMLYDLTPGHSRKVPLADLDLVATAQQNDNRGISFELPRAAAAN